MLQQAKSAIHLSALQIHETHRAQLARAKKQIAITRDLLHTVRNTRTVHSLLLEEIHEHFLQLTAQRRKLKGNA
jgi:hypothetical protein